MTELHLPDGWPLKHPVSVVSVVLVLLSPLRANVLATDLEETTEPRLMADGSSMLSGVGALSLSLSRHSSFTPQPGL